MNEEEKLNLKNQEIYRSTPINVLTERMMSKKINIDSP